MPDQSTEPSRQGRLVFGNTLNDIVDDLKTQLDSVDGAKPYRYVERAKITRTRLTYPVQMDLSIVQGVQDYIGAGRTPYGHQFQTWIEMYAGKSVIITTPTASGKTLAFNPVILGDVLNRGASALYIFPLVDLATSQEDALRKLIEKALPHAGDTRPPHISGFHSGSSQEWGDKSNGQQDFVLTTPESLHRSLLPRNYRNWCRFFRHLRYVVLDEAHVYSGIFGTNMAYLLRRLIHRCLKDGGQAPQFVVCSATVKDPESFARKLLPPGIGQIAWISKSTAPAPDRHETAFLAQRKVAVDLFTRLLDAEVTDEMGENRPVRTIMFVHSRKAVNDFVQAVRKGLEKEQRMHLAERFDGYMANLPNTRHLFERLRNGDLQSIVTTNKLMAGIDIGDLDVSMVYRFQRRFLDMRQMFGRAGRRGTGAWIFIGSPKSLEDQYVVDSFPEVFDCTDPEATVVDLSNTILRDAHMRCLNGYVLNNSRFQEGPARMDLVRALFGEGVVVPPDETVSTPWESNPLDGLQLRGANIETNYRIVLNGKEETGDDAHDIPQNLAFRDYHPEAIFEFESDVFRVVELRPPPGAKIIAISAERDVRTACRERVDDRLLEDLGSVTRYGVDLVLGRFHIEKVFSDYNLLTLEESWECPRRNCDMKGYEGETCLQHKRRLRYVRSWKKVGNKSIFPPLSIPIDTTGVEIDMGKLVQEYWDDLNENPDPPIPVSDSEMNELLTGVKTLVVNSFEDAYLAEGEILGVLVKPNKRLLFYDDFPGGIGVVKAMYDDRDGLIWKKALWRVQRCKCKAAEGCVKCVLPPFAQTGEVMEKRVILDFMRWYVSRYVGKVAGGVR